MWTAGVLCVFKDIVNERLSFKSEVKKWPDQCGVEEMVTQ